jgi:uncharacterized membrane protein YcaP (DUF421 family)
MKVWFSRYLGRFFVRARMAFCVLLLYLRLMGRAHKVDWTVTFLVTTIFTMPVSIAEMGGKFHPSLLLIAFAFYAC